MSIEIQELLRSGKFDGWEKWAPEAQLLLRDELKRAVETLNLKVPQTDDELKLLVRDTCGVILPDTQVCTNHTTPFRAFSDAFFARSPVTVWKASRGFGGKSFLLALLGHVEAFTLGAEVAILGGSGEQSLGVMRYLQKFTGGEQTMTQRQSLYGSGGKIRAQMASSTSVRGPHPQRLRLDEVDEMELEILDAAMGQPISTAKIAKQTVMSSTHHYPDATFSEILKRADDNQWPVMEWCVDGDSDILTPNGQVKMKDLSIGDSIYAFRDGQLIRTQIINAWQSGLRPTLRIETDAGVLRCTAEHRVLTVTGWKEAGSLTEGEIVRAVWQTKSPSLQRQNLQEVSLRQQVFGLRNRHYGRSEAVLCLSRQDSRGAGEGAGREVNMSVLQRPEANRIAGLSHLLSQRTYQAEHSRSGNNGTSTAADFTLRNKPQAPQFRRDGSKGIVLAFIRSLFGGTAFRPLRGRFCFPRIQFGRGGQWQILAHEARTGEARPLEEESGGSDGFNTSSAVDRSTPSVDFAVVRRIERNATIPVYDITVAEGSSFIANGIVVHNCYQESSAHPDGWLDVNEILSKQKEVTAAMWAAEYDLQEPSPEDRAILTEKVDACFRKNLIEWGRDEEHEWKGQLGERIEIEPPTPEAKYATGCDWAKKKDFTIIDTLRIDCQPFRRVAWQRTGRLPWPMMIARFEQQVKRYPGRSCHDATGLGDVVEDYQGANAEPVVLVGQTRSDVFTKYIAAIENGAIISPKIRHCENEHRYCTNDDLRGTGHPPDSFIAGAMAYRAAMKREPVEDETYSFGFVDY
jgi:hypothetical protein